MTDYARSRES